MCPFRKWYRSFKEWNEYRIAVKKRKAELRERDPYTYK